MNSAANGRVFCVHCGSHRCTQIVPIFPQKFQFQFLDISAFSCAAMPISSFPRSFTFFRKMFYCHRLGALAGSWCPVSMDMFPHIGIRPVLFISRFSFFPLFPFEAGEKDLTAKILPVVLSSLQLKFLRNLLLQFSARIS